MKKILIVVFVIVTTCINAYSQLYMTRTGMVGFYSKTPMEDIRAENNQVYAVIDAGKKNIAITLLVKSFIFPKELMQEHFNENYIESDKYPKANFTGAYTGELSLNKDAVYTIAVNGNLTLHGITRALTVPATLEVKGGKLLGQTHFKVRPEDYNIIIPSLVREKIAKEMSLVVNIDCNPVK
jgi:hypothetical protein